jgi:uncharacterized protein
MSSEAFQVQHNKARSRYEVEVDGKLAMLVYRDTDGMRYYLHTEVPPELEGHGIASTLAKTALDEAQAEHLTIVPLCPFVRSYIQRHQQYQPLVQS